MPQLLDNNESHNSHARVWAGATPSNRRVRRRGYDVIMGLEGRVQYDVITKGVLFHNP